MPTKELRARVEQLHRDRTPFVLATVVRAERPTSAKPGDSAVVLPDGSITGFVGGVCAESTVRLAGLRLLRSGECELLRVTPVGPEDSDGTAGTQQQEGLRVVGNPCLSGGTLDIFLETIIPPVLVRIFGESPVARALVTVGTALGYDVRAGTDPAEPLAPDTSAVVVASHGRDEEPMLRAAVDSSVPYVALVASPKRAAAVLHDLDAGPELTPRVHAPAGLDIGARTPEEIAVSIYAQIIASRAHPRTAAESSAQTRNRATDQTRDEAIEEARDPVCGMAVAATPTSLSVSHDGRTWYFCGSGCRDAFRHSPAEYQ